MKENNTTLLIALAAGLYLWNKNKDNTPLSSDGSFNEAVPPTGAPVYGEMITSSPNGKLTSTTITSVAQGVNAINTAVSTGQTILSNGRTLVRSNQTVTDQSGNTYKTASNQTISQLPSGNTVVLTVKPVTNSFFDKPIKNINGKNTRVY